jgi:hypothetical protein
MDIYGQMIFNMVPKQLGGKKKDSLFNQKRWSSGTSLYRTSITSIHKSGIAESNGRSMFSFLSSLHIFFQSGCTSLHSHQQCKKGSFFPESSPIPVVCGVANDGYSNRGEVES